jgi:hypothetical protein
MFCPAAHKVGELVGEMSVAATMRSFSCSGIASRASFGLPAIHDSSSKMKSSLQVKPKNQDV